MILRMVELIVTPKLGYTQEQTIYSTSRLKLVFHMSLEHSYIILFPSLIRKSQNWLTMHP